MHGDSYNSPYKMLEAPYKARRAADISGMYNRDRDIEPVIWKPGPYMIGVVIYQAGSISYLHLYAHSSDLMK